MISGAILVIACLGVGYFVTSPQWTKYSLGKDKLVGAQNDNQHYKQALASMQNFLDKYKNYASQVPTVNLALPAKSFDLPNFASSMSNLAKASGVVLSNFSIQDAISPTQKNPVENSIQTVLVSLSAVGTYPSFKDFILRLEQHLRIVDIGHVSIRGDSTGQVQYQINLQTYYQK